MTVRATTLKIATGTVAQSSWQSPASVAVGQLAVVPARPDSPSGGPAAARPDETLPYASYPLAHELAALVEEARPIHLARGQTLFDVGEPALSCFVVSSGTLRGCRFLADGRRYIGSFFLAGDCIGIGIAGTYPYAAEAVTDTSLLSYQRAQLDRLLASRLSLVHALLYATSERLIHAHEHMLALGRKTANERLAAFLLTMADRMGSADGVCLPMPHEDIGDHLGITSETVSRAFAHLRAMRLIAMDGRRKVMLLDRARLAAVARSD